MSCKCCGGAKARRISAVAIEGEPPVTGYGGDGDVAYEESYCCVAIKCAPINIEIFGIHIVGWFADHCWVEVADECAGTTHRYDVWMEELPAFDPSYNADYEKIGRHLYRNMADPGKWQGFPDSAIDTICESCEICGVTHDGGCLEPEEFNVPTCDCVSEAAREYPLKDQYPVLPILGRNSNSFVEYIIDKCGLDCQLPLRAVGARMLPGVAGVGVRSGELRIEFGLFGLGVGALGVHADIGDIAIFGITGSGIVVANIDIPVLDAGASAIVFTVETTLDVGGAVGGAVGDAGSWAGTAVGDAFGFIFG